MPRVALFLFVAAIIAFSAPSGTVAQSIIDLSKPQTGKSRFVLNSDLTPADLGEVEAETSANREPGVSRVGSPMAPTADRRIVVNAYTRKDGTQVRGHTRSAPTQGRGRR